MKIFKLIAHWTFALFVAIISFIVALALFAFLITKIATPIDNPHNQAIINLIAYSAKFMPFMAASFFGIITAPNNRRHIASIVLPTFVFLVINMADYCWSQHYNFSIQWFLLTGASCAVVGTFLYFKWTQQLLKSEQKES